MVSAAAPATDTQVSVASYGSKIELDQDTSASLGRAVEEMLARCEVANWSVTEWPRTEVFKLSVTVTYSPPQSVTLSVLSKSQFAVREVLFVADSGRNEGWPLLYISGAGRAGQLGKCDGLGTLKLMCSPTLKPLVPATFMKNCGTVRP